MLYEFNKTKYEFKTRNPLRTNRLLFLFFKLWQTEDKVKCCLKNCKKTLIHCHYQYSIWKCFMNALNPKWCCIQLERPPYSNVLNQFWRCLSFAYKLHAADKWICLLYEREKHPKTCIAHILHITLTHGARCVYRCVLYPCTACVLWFTHAHTPMHWRQNSVDLWEVAFDTQTLRKVLTNVKENKEEEL